MVLQLLIEILYYTYILIGYIKMRNKTSLYSQVKLNLAMWHDFFIALSSVYTYILDFKHCLEH